MQRVAGNYVINSGVHANKLKVHIHVSFTQFGRRTDNASVYSPGVITNIHVGGITTCWLLAGMIPQESSLLISSDMFTGLPVSIRGEGGGGRR